MNAISNAVSGMMAATARINASASNIANARTQGPVPSTPPSQPLPAAEDGEPQAYQAIETVQTTTEGGGTAASYKPVLPSYTKDYDPSSPFANDQGLVASPNVDMTREVLNEIQAVNAYKASARVVEASNEMTKSLIDANI